MIVITTAAMTPTRDSTMTVGVASPCACATSLRLYRGQLCLALTQQQL